MILQENGQGQEREQNEVILFQALERFDVSYDYFKDLYDAYRDDTKFLYNIDNHQWPVEARVQRANRPMITVNKLKKFVKAVSGQQRQNKMGIKVNAEGGDKETADALSIIIKNISKDSGATAIYADEFEKQITGGFGYWRYVYGFESDESFNKVITCKRIQDPTTVYLDPSAQEYSREDGRYGFIVDTMSKEEFQYTWPGIQIPDSTFRSLGYTTRQNWILDDTIQVAEYYFKVPVQKRLYLLNDGNTVLTSLDDEPSKEFLDLVIKVRLVDTFDVMWTTLTEFAILEPIKKWPGKYIPIIPVIGSEIHIDQRYYVDSFVRGAKDPQRMYNYWRTAATEYVAGMPKNPYIVTKKQIAGHERQWQNANRGNPLYLVVNDVEGAKIPQRNPAPAIPTGIVTEANIASGDIDDTLGMYEASKGQSGNERTGAAIQTRQQVSSTITYGFVDNFIKSMFYSGKILIDLIPNVMTVEQLINDFDDKGKLLQSIVVNKTVYNPKTGKYEQKNTLKIGKHKIAVDVGFGYSTRRQEAVQGMLQMFQYLPGFGQFFADIFAENMDWPGAEEVAGRFKALLPPQFQEDGGVSVGNPLGGSQGMGTPPISSPVPPVVGQS